MEQTSSPVVLEPDPEGGYLAVVPGVPDGKPLAWEGEGWS